MAPLPPPGSASRDRELAVRRVLTTILHQTGLTEQEIDIALTQADVNSTRARYRGLVDESDRIRALREETGKIWWQREGRKIALRLIRRRGYLNHHDIEDRLQTCLLAIHRVAIPKYKPELGLFKAWANWVMRGAIRDRHLRPSVRHMVEAVDEAGTLLVPAVLAQPPEDIELRKSPQEDLWCDDVEFRVQLESCDPPLSVEERLILVEGWKPSEVIQARDGQKDPLKADALRQRARRRLEQLRPKFKNWGEPS